MKVFNVGDKARVRKDLVGCKYYESCTYNSCYCNHAMTNYAGDVVVVSEKDDRTGFMHLRSVENGFTTEMPFSWSDGMLEPLEEEQPHGFLTVGSVVKIRSDILNRPVTCEKNAMENITKIEVTVMSGDETGCFYGVYNGKPWQYRFDAAESRFASYDDGSYTVEGKENIEKWINWSYDTEKAIYAEYSMERMRAFRKRE